MFLVAFYGLFRIGELATKSTRVAASVIQFNNLTFLSTHEAKISISNYKHNTSNRPFDIILAREVSQPFFSIVQLVGTAQDPFSATRIIPQFLFTNSIANSNGV